MPLPEPDPPDQANNAPSPEEERQMELQEAQRRLKLLQELASREKPGSQEQQFLLDMARSAQAEVRLWGLAEPQTDPDQPMQPSPPAAT